VVTAPVDRSAGARRRPVWLRAVVAAVRRGVPSVAASLDENVGSQRRHGLPYIAVTGRKLSIFGVNMRWLFNVVTCDGPTTTARGACAPRITPKIDRVLRVPWLLARRDEIDAAASGARPTRVCSAHVEASRLIE